MAPTKRKKLEKTNQEHQHVGVQKFYCCRCSHIGGVFSRQKGYFPVSHSPMYRGTGYLPLCNNCVEELFDEYCKKLGSDRDAMKRMCMKLDLYWNDSIYDMVERSAGINSRIRNYIGKTNLIRFIDKTYDDTLLEEALAQSKANADENTVVGADGIAFIKPTPDTEESPVRQKDVNFWGTGFTADRYGELNRKYNEWTKNLPPLTTPEKAFYKQICLLEATISRDSAAGKNTDKNINMLNTLLGSMNLKPTQQKDEIDSSVEKTPFGVWIRRFENEKPIPEPDPDLQDVDNVVRNIQIWFLGHLCKMLNIRNTYCKMYEDEIAKMRIERPEYEDEDDETMINDIFGNKSTEENDE